MYWNSKITIGVLTVIIVLQFVLLQRFVKINHDLLETNEMLTKKVITLQEKEQINKKFEVKSLGEHVLTFYTHTGYNTASGVYPRAGRTVAVDTKFIPHGTLLYIEGVGFRMAEDTGGDIKGNRLDIFVDTREEAVKKGVKKAKVYTIKGKV